MNVPIGRPRQMVAIDILKVSLSNNKNRYLLVSAGLKCRRQFPYLTRLQQDLQRKWLNCFAAELQDLVEPHIVESAQCYKGSYNQNSAERSFKVGDLVWLSILTADGKGNGK